MSYLVFVYGTLQRGERYHDVMGDAEYLGTLCLSSEYTLYDLGDYPGAVHGGTSALQGEVYRVAPEQLHALDELEEVPTLYRRSWVMTPLGRAIMYLLVAEPENAPVVDSGDWRSHRLERQRLRQ